MSNEATTKISARIIAEVGKGKTLAEAIDSVLGNGVYEQVVNEVYADLRAS